MATISTHLFNRFNRSSEPSVEQEQLLKLFWNRAELKKAFDRLRDERTRLDDELRKQHAMVLRVQQRIEQLEVMLANPETAQRAMTYYHLRAVWDACYERIGTLAENLERSCRDRELREHAAEFRSRMQRRVAEVRRDAQRVQQVADGIRDEIRGLRELRSRRFGWWNFFTRRRLTREIRSKREEHRVVAGRLDELTNVIRELKSAETPPFPGLSIEARRLINLRIIACAQELYLLLATDDLANLAREAATRDIRDVRYGSHRDCRALSRTAAEARLSLDGDTLLLKRVQRRARYLATVCEYRNDADTVPMAGSLAGIARLDGEGRRSGEAAGVNVLVDEYWNIFSVLLD